MNFLAHAFLNPANNHVLVGNFFGDSFKGRAEKYAPLGIVEGIKLHREIDHFTDTHSLVLESISLFRKQQGRWAPVVIDLIFDHILASNFKSWCDEDLRSFSESIFLRLDSNEDFIPDLAQRFYPHMRKHNWLLHYQKEAGLKLALEGMDRRVSAESSMVDSLEIMAKHRSELNDLFSLFFKDLVAMVNNYLESNGSDIGSSRVPLK